MINHPVLYSYRRCPYAMRVRMALYLSDVQVEQREIVFWDKPAPMLEASPKGTVPVLVLANGQVIDESRDIMLWAFEQASMDDNKSGQTCLAWIPKDVDLRQKMNSWIDQNDGEFKVLLDKYKYADRFPDESQLVYRQGGELFLKVVEQALSEQNYLLGDNLTMADIALFPFIRQFVNVDKVWFEMADYPMLKVWLSELLESEFFLTIMKNRPAWILGDTPLWLSEPDLQTRDQFVERARRS